MTAPRPNILMVSADRGVVAGERGPFYYMLEAFRRHWGRVDVIGTRPERVETARPFENVFLHHPTHGKLRQAAFIARTGRRLAAERPYAVITSHDYNPFYNGWGTWRISRATGIPFLSEIHHVPGHPRAASVREHFDRVATRWYVRWVERRAAGFRVVNRHEMPALLGSWGIDPARIHVMPSLYLDLEVNTPGEPRETAQCDLLMVGRLVASKGFLEAIDAWRRVDDLVPGGLRMRIIGRGPLREAIVARARRHGLLERLEIVEWVPDAAALADAYRSARVFVCASASEGGPRVVVEAMACGTPVVSTRVGIVPDVIEDGVNGFIYDGSVAGLAEVLRRALDPAREREVRARLPGDLSRFDRERVIEALARDLRAVAASAAAAR